MEAHQAQTSAMQRANRKRNSSYQLELGTIVDRLNKSDSMQDKAQIYWRV